MKIVSTNCACGHEKRDHAFPLVGSPGRGSCKVCLCDRYTKVAARDSGAKAAKNEQPVGG